MSRVADIEAEMQESFASFFGALPIYADALQAAADPRGELIALDLMPAPADPAWWGRRRAALAAWLGEPAAGRLGHLVQHGFVHELREGPLAGEVLDGPLGRWVRGYTAWGDSRVRTGLERLAARPRPWLTRVAVTSWGPPVRDELCGELCAAAPRLAAIHARGEPLFRDFHPVVAAVADDGLYPSLVTGPRIAADELELVLDAADGVRDCNQLYAYYDIFDEPLASLLPRLRAAAYLDLDGPVARGASIGVSSETRQAAPARWRRWSTPLWIDVGLAPPVEVGPIGGFGEAIRDALRELRLPRAMHKALASLLEMLDVLGARWTRVPPPQVTPLALAIDAIVEQSDLRGRMCGSAGPLATAASHLGSPDAVRGVSLRIAYDDD